MAVAERELTAGPTIGRETLTGGQGLVKAAINNGAERAYILQGGAIMPTLDAVASFPDQLRVISARHEQVLGHMAEGDARVTGKPALVVVTSGPGATNMVTPIYNARLDRTPLVVVAGQPAGKLEDEPFQGVDVVGITQVITNWAHRITPEDNVFEIVNKAYRIARGEEGGRPGPVVIEFRKDLQSRVLDYSNTNHVPQPKELELSDDAMFAIDKAAELIKEAKKAVIIAGHGVKKAHAEAELLDLSEKTGMGVAYTLHGVDDLPSDHPNNLGMVGMHGELGANLAIDRAKLVVGIGLRFDDRVTGRTKDFAKSAKIIHIDTDKTQLGRNVPIEVGIHGDAKLVLQELLKRVSKGNHQEWVDEARRLTEYARDRIRRKLFAATQGEINMLEAMEMLSEIGGRGAVVFADVGQHQMDAARYMQHQYPDSFFTSGGAGAMGYSVPAAIGAKIARPNREVIAVVGDGSFQMTQQALITMVEENAPIKIALINNEAYGMVEMWHKAFFEERYVRSRLMNPDFVKIADANYIRAEMVSQPEQLGPAIQRMFDYPGAVLLDIRTAKNKGTFPIMKPGASLGEIILGEGEGFFQMSDLELVGN